jgi:ubiquinone/menaquinone biosynthesis C-methylase UbiE
MGVLHGVIRATGELVSWLVLTVLWPVLHVVSVIRPAPFPPWLTPILEGPLRRRLQDPERCVEQSGLAPSMTVLEVGPGAGYATEAAARKLSGSGRLVCLDLQLDMLRRLRARLGTTASLLVCASGSELPFREGVFDLTFLVGVLGEIPDKDAALREYRRTLRPGGTLAVTEGFPDPDYIRASVLERMAVRCGFEVSDRFSAFPSNTQQLRRPAGMLT